MMDSNSYTFFPPSTLTNVNNKTLDLYIRIYMIYYQSIHICHYFNMLYIASGAGINPFIRVANWSSFVVTGLMSGLLILLVEFWNRVDWCRRRTSACRRSIYMVAWLFKILYASAVIDIFFKLFLRICRMTETIAVDNVSDDNWQTIDALFLCGFRLLGVAIYFVLWLFTLIVSTADK
jgi:hypothetical protein